jgi:hypothetical protein
MTRRSGAAKALVEQPGSCLPRVQGSPAAVVSSVTPNAQREVWPPHCPVPGEHLSSTPGRSPSRTAPGRAEVTIAVSAAALRCSSDPDVANGAYRRFRSCAFRWARRRAGAQIALFGAVRTASRLTRGGVHSGGWARYQFAGVTTVRNSLRVLTRGGRGSGARNHWLRPCYLCPVEEHL